jgi:hypothetical protein
MKKFELTFVKGGKSSFVCHRLVKSDAVEVALKHAKDRQLHISAYEEDFLTEDWEGVVDDNTKYVIREVEE